jgi:hypothetical protein
MTSREFVIWLKGFISASNHYNLTPKAWDELKQQLNTVTDHNNFIDNDYDEDINNRRMDIIGQNGNDGLHYNKIF